MDKEINYQLNLQDWSVTDNGRVSEVMSRELNLSRKEISRLKFDGEILLNGKRVRVNDHMRVGDTLTLRFPEISTGPVPVLKTEPEILYEDEDMVIVNKPAGIPSHPVHGHMDDSMGTILASWYQQAGVEFVIRPVGRLDKDVSGALIYAKNRLSAARLSRDRQDGKLRKYYCAFAQGVLEAKNGVIDAPIAKVEGQRRRESSEEDGKPARTHYQVRREFHVGSQSISFLDIEIETGRTHQIRAHLASIGHPLLGDELYGGDMTLMNRPALHCSRIDFLTPFTRQLYEVDAPLMEDMSRLLEVYDAAAQGLSPAEKEAEVDTAGNETEPAEETGNAGDRILAALKETSELSTVDEPAVRDETPHEKGKIWLKILLAIGLLIVLAALGFAAITAFRRSSLRTLTLEKEELMKALTIEFRDETLVEYGGDFHPHDYILSSQGQVSVEGSVDTMKLGEQTIRYILTTAASDGSDVRQEVSRSFTVKDTLEPVITLAQDQVRVDLNETYDPADNVKSVNDPVDGKVDYTIDDGGLDTTKDGIYTVTVSASDRSGNKAEKTFRVTVGKETDPQSSPVPSASPSSSPSVSPSPSPAAAADTAGPVITLSTNAVSLQEGDSFSAGSLVVSVIDETDGALSYTESLVPGSYTISSDVNASAAGNYTVNVTAVDRAGNRAQASASVTVSSKPTPSPTPEPTAAPSGGSVPDSADAKGQIYQFLTGVMGFNKAQACGILANMHRESRFNPQADNGIGYYGLCQWGGDRKDNLISWCEENGYDYTTIDGQLHFLQYEMPLYYPNTTAQFKACPNEKEGARKACWIFAIGYEVAGEYYAEMSKDKAAEYFNE